MKLTQLVEAKYIGRTKINTVTFGAGEDGIDEQIETTDGFSEYFITALQGGMIQRVTYDEMYAEMHSGEGWWDDIYGTHAEREYNINYLANAKRAVEEFVKLAWEADAIFSIGIEYDQGFTLIDDIDALPGALEQWVREHGPSDEHEQRTLMHEFQRNLS